MDNSRSPPNARPKEDVMFRASLIAFILTSALLGCSDSQRTDQTDQGDVAEYAAWARARVNEIAIVLDELEAHFKAADRDRGLENEQPWRDRAEVLINGTRVVVAAVRARETVPAEAAATHQQVLELVTEADTMVVNAARAIGSSDAQDISAAMDARIEFNRLEPRVLTALNALAAPTAGP